MTWRRQEPWQSSSNTHTDTSLLSSTIPSNSKNVKPSVLEWDWGCLCEIILCVCSVAQSCPALCNPWTVACQPPLSMEFSRQEYWNGLPCPPPGSLSNPAIKPSPLASPALASGLFTTTWEIILFLCCSLSRWLCDWVRTSRWEDWWGSWPVEPITWSRETRPKERGRGPKETERQGKQQWKCQELLEPLRTESRGQVVHSSEQKWNQRRKHTKLEKTERTAYFLSKNEKVAHPSPPLPKHAWSLV